MVVYVPLLDTAYAADTADIWPLGGIIFVKCEVSLVK